LRWISPLRGALGKSQNRMRGSSAQRDDDAQRVADAVADDQYFDLVDTLRLARFSPRTAASRHVHALESARWRGAWEVLAVGEGF
jgi:hypothetical protein